MRECRREYTGGRQRPHRSRCRLLSAAEHVRCTARPQKRALSAVQDPTHHPGKKDRRQLRRHPLKRYENRYVTWRSRCVQCSRRGAAGRPGTGRLGDPLCATQCISNFDRRRAESPHAAVVQLTKVSRRSTMRMVSFVSLSCTQGECI